MDVSVIGRTSVDAPFPIRVLSLLFRPFFFDANDILGIVVSIENAGWLSLSERSCSSGVSWLLL
jgi:hypothetical protein